LTSAAFVTSFKAPSMSFESINSSKMRACDGRDLREAFFACCNVRHANVHQRAL
jgi:hypothetical protein